MEQPTSHIRAEIAALSDKEGAAARCFIEVDNYSFNYGSRPVLSQLDFAIERERVTAFIGPSGCGKSTLLRCFNRMNDLVDNAWHRGDIRIAGTSIYSEAVEPMALRRRIGMVFQHSNPFPKTIYENVVFGLRVAGERKKGRLDTAAEKSLREVALWHEVKDRLHESALSLSGGQTQRLCIARAIATGPDIILMDEPCSALDPVATARIEELINDLKQRFTIIIVTHNMQQAARISDRTAFFYDGRLVEYERTDEIFMNPREEQTEAYVSGRFG
jgi:phosphate transport system ATP-binding protein